MDYRLTVNNTRTCSTTRTLGTDDTSKSRTALEEKIYLAAAAARDALTRELGKHVQPKSRYCFDMCHEMPKWLPPDIGLVTQSGILYDHQCLILIRPEGRYIIDAAYLQFVDEKYHDSLPSVMIIKLTNEPTLDRELRTYKVHEHWLPIWRKCF